MASFPTTPVSTQVTATGRPIVLAVEDAYTLMLWTSSTANYPIWAGTAKAGAYAPTAKQTTLLSRSGAGPAFVMMPTGKAGFLVYVNATQQVVVVRATADTTASPVTWSLAKTGTKITGSKAASGATAALQLQNDQPVLTIIWQDQGAGSLVYSQVTTGDSLTGTASFATLAGSSQGAPWLTSFGGASYLAFAGLDGSFNLAIDREGGVDFDFANAFVTEAISSDHGPAYVPLDDDQGYVAWASGDGLAYQQIGINSDGDWQPNPAPECQGVFPGIVPSGDVHAQFTHFVDANGTTQNGILVAAASATAAKANTVMIAGFVPDRSPIPLPDAQPTEVTQ